MDNELEEIDLDTIDLNNENNNIALEDGEGQSEDIVDTTDNSQDNANTNNSIDEDKESLKRAMNRERKARKEAERKNKEFEQRIIALEEANKTPIKTTAEELIENGIDEEVAKSIGNAIDKKQNNSSEITKELENLKFENSLIKKSKERGFENISDYSEEIKTYVDKGLTLDESYMLVKQKNSVTKDTKSELERKVEAKLQNNNARREILGSYNDNKGATNTSKPIKITSVEKELAIQAGLTPEEYVAMRDIDSIDDYNKYKSRKK